MKQIGSRSVVTLIIALFFVFCAGFYLFSFVTYGARWAAYPTNRHLFTDGKLVKAGTITDRNDKILAETVDGKRSFSENADIRKATIHAVGDLEGRVSTGVQNSFLKQLTGYELLNGAYNVSGEGNGMKLTLDADLCVTAMKALGDYSGTVGVYNYKTGEIICMVSTGTFDPTKTVPDNAASQGIYVNRLLSGRYTPGSVFKLVTATSAIDHIPDIFERKFTCKQGVEIEGEWVSCLQNHGTLSFEQALVHSCNATFAQIAVELGKSNMMKTADRLGFNRTLTMDGIKCAQSSYQVSNARNIELAWSGMGQYNDLVNPFQYLTMMGAIANGGVPVKPYLVENIITPEGLPTRLHLFKNGERMMETSTANKLKDMMRNNVLQNYGDSNFPGLELCAKTGTAEVGTADPHSWFVGFSRSEKKPYAFVVVAENAGAGIKVAARIANTVLQKAPSV